LNHINKIGLQSTSEVFIAIFKNPEWVVVLELRNLRGPAVFSYRSRMDIIANILESAKEEISKTKLMYSCGLSFDHFQTYLNFLVERELIEIFDRRGQIVIRRTNRGNEFLRLYYTIQNIINK